MSRCVVIESCPQHQLVYPVRDAQCVWEGRQANFSSSAFVLGKYKTMMPSRWTLEPLRMACLHDQMAIFHMVSCPYPFTPAARSIPQRDILDKREGPQHVKFLLSRFPITCKHCGFVPGCAREQGSLGL